MPFDSNGNFSLVPGTIVSDGMTIQPSQHNPPFQDVASGLSQVVVRDGRAPMTGPLNMNGNRISGVSSGSQPGDVVTRADISDLAVAIGDGAWSLRDLSPNWLRRNGALYLRANYPELAAILPVLPDGVVWENIPSGVNMPLRGVSQSPTRFFAIGRIGSGESSIIASINGGSWNVRQTLSAPFFGEKVAYGGGIYAAIGGNGNYSQSVDGDVWSTPAFIDTGTVGLTGFTFGNGYFVASGGRDGQGALWRSPDAVTWTRVGPTSVGWILSVSYLGDRFVAVGRDGVLFYSVDGGTWTSSNTGTGVNLNAVGYWGGTYVIVGDGGFIATSNTLSGWTVRASGTTQNLNKITGGTSGFMVVGAGGVVRISGNGNSWVPIPSGTNSNLFDVLIDDNNQSLYIVVGPPSNIMYGTRTQPTQFRVPNDDPTYGWVRAL